MNTLSLVYLEKQDTEVFTVSFYGYPKIENSLLIEQRLELLICKLLKEKEYVEFLVGRDVEFDQLVSSVIYRCKREYRSANSAHVWVLPYPTADYEVRKEAEYPLYQF